tara:strand:+ start:12477 stop:14228 length:1752 start_codon:yes stop_codon:yes gene_type:complete
MANGYKSSSSSLNSVKRSTTNARGQVAPPGFHYMPDGSLMSDAEHNRLYSGSSVSDKILKSFNLDLSDLPASQEGRSFDIIGSKGSEFVLEIKNEDNYYYNFSTKSFQSTPYKLEDSIKSNKYSGVVMFPTVTDDDQYDFYLYAKPGTKHVEHKEVRFEDGSVDINSSVGSSSLMLRKVIYQYTDLTLTIAANSPTPVTDLIKSSTRVDDTITVSRGRNSGVVPFKISCEVNNAAKTYQVVRQPIERDLSIEQTLTVGSAPELLPGENEYPAVTETAQVQIGGISSSATIILRTPVPDITVGDMWTSDGAMPIATQFVQSVTVDGNGDVTQFVTNTAANHAGSANLTFYARKNFQWPVSDINNISVGMDVTSNVNLESNTQVSNYTDVLTVLENTEKEQSIVKHKAFFKNTKGVKPTVTKGVITTQTGNIVFNKQTKLALASGSITIVAHGIDQMHKLSGYKFRITDLKVRLAPVSTTTTAAVVNSTSVPVASRNGILDNVSIVSGIGIDPVKANPKVASGAGAVSGSGTIVLDIAQTLENGATLNIDKSGQKATVTGNIEVLKAGTGAQTLKINMENLLSIT